MIATGWKRPRASVTFGYRAHLRMSDRNRRVKFNKGPNWFQFRLGTTVLRFWYA